MSESRLLTRVVRKGTLLLVIMVLQVPAAHPQEKANQPAPPLDKIPDQSSELQKIDSEIEKAKTAGPTPAPTYIAPDPWKSTGPNAPQGETKPPAETDSQSAYSECRAMFPLNTPYQVREKMNCVRAGGGKPYAEELKKSRGSAPPSSKAEENQLKPLKKYWDKQP